MKVRDVLTTKQQETLNYLENYLSKHNEAPLLSEMKEEFDLSSTRSVTQRLDSLEEKGYITRDRFKHRGIRIVNSRVDELASQFIRLPVYASVGCDNETIFAKEDNITGYVSVDKEMIGTKKVVVMKAVGNSMVDANVNNGDYVLIEETESVENGDRVVAIVNDMAVLKKLQKIENGYVLHAEAKGYEPIILNDDSKIFGKLIAVIPMGAIETADEYTLETVYN
jgi:repressor LexA